jgi:hypothetical protein
MNGRFQRCAQRGNVCGVHDCVVNEHDIELARQAQRAHVSDEVLTVGIERMLTASIAADRSEASV